MKYLPVEATQHFFAVQNSLSSWLSQRLYPTDIHEQLTPEYIPYFNHMIRYSCLSLVYIYIYHTIHIYYMYIYKVYIYIMYIYIDIIYICIHPVGYTRKMLHLCPWSITFLYCFDKNVVNPPFSDTPKSIVHW